MPTSMSRDDDANARPDAVATAARHDEWLMDEGIRGSFPASDPASIRVHVRGPRLQLRWVARSTANTSVRPPRTTSVRSRTTSSCSRHSIVMAMARSRGPGRNRIPRSFSVSVLVRLTVSRRASMIAYRLSELGLRGFAASAREGARMPRPPL